MRSVWKLASIKSPFLRSSFLNKIENQQYTKIWAKGIRVFSDLSEKNLQVYNGSKFIDLPIRSEMSGQFLGSFVLCKKITSSIHSKTKKNKRGRLNKHKKKTK
jgi:Ribosomal protein S19